MPFKISGSVTVPKPVALTPEPSKALAVRLPLEISTMTVRAVELVPSAPAASVMWPLLVETVRLAGRLKAGRLTAEAVGVTVLTVTLLAAELPPVMPVLWPLSVALTVPLPLALRLPAAR